MIGSTLSHYKITAELGRGGMGIVYRATDTKLNREVALKVLPAAALSSEDDRARFFREAQAAAQLTHAHIATVYEIDEAVVRDEEGDPVNGSDGPRPFIAMEYIEGETLEERIKTAPLKLDEAVRLAIETADALKAAHAKNIVHRDIKSANVMVTSEGKAKVLDFGLAKTTHSTMLTRMGSTLGTVAFMSPEQARGEEVDSRTDLYSLGTVLYEMIAGRRPFAGEYEQAVVYAILNEAAPPLTSLRSGVPMNLEWIVNKCLAKKATDRYQTASDLIVDLRNLDLSASAVSSISMSSTLAMGAAQLPGSGYGAAQTAEPGTVVPAARAVPIKRSMVPAVAAASATLLLGLLAGYLFFRTEPEPKPLLRVSIDLPDMRQVRFPTMSPGNEYLAFVGMDGSGNSGIFLRTMATGEIRYIQNTESAGPREIVFSPGGARLAYTSSSNSGVSTVVLPAGLPEQQSERGRMLFWDGPDTIYFLNDVPGGETFRKNIGMSEPELIELDHGIMDDGYVDILKTYIRESGIVFGHRIARTTNTQTAMSWLIRTSLRGGKAVEPIESPIMNPAYVIGGFLAYQQRNDTGTLVVRPVDPGTGNFLGPPREALTGESTAWGNYSVTPSGDLIYIPSPFSAVAAPDRLFLIDLEKRVANLIQLVIPSGTAMDDVVFSPDGSKLAFTIGAGNEEYIAIYDFRDESLTQITYGDQASGPVWSWDGAWIYYSVRSGATTDLFRKRPDASSVAESVLSNAVIGGVSPDGRHLAVSAELGVSTADLMLFDMETKELSPIDTSDGLQIGAEFSPDGQYVVYQQRDNTLGLRVSSIDGSRKSDIADVQVRGTNPRWSADGRYIYFTGAGTYRIPVRTSPSFNILGDPELLFNSVEAYGFDISPDGKTATLISSDVYFESGNEAGPTLIWLQNWSDHLKREFGK